MTNSILETIKTMLGILKEDAAFDTELIMHINSALMHLVQLIPGIDKYLSIKGYDETWTDFFGDRKDLDSVIEYVHISTKLMFDPPTSSYVLTAFQEVKKECEFRLSLQGDAEDSGDEGIITVDYNTQVFNKPSLNGTELKGDVQMDIASTEYVDGKVGVIEDGYY